MKHLLIILVGLLVSFAAAARAEDAQTIRRFAVVVGSNLGGKDRAELRYAQRDARAVGAVLEQLGGVEKKDKTMLLEPTPEQLLSALQQIGQRARDAAQHNQRTELLFYYSGHSDERGLLLGEDRLSYRELRDGLAAVSASVHVGVLDSCASGALTRLKGGERRAPFLLDHSNAVQGHAFLTSASADEGAQESDRVGASFFTHYLVSGLRGAADYSGDGRVTLNEAYRFAFDETLARTEDTHAGPQHASYDIQLVGTGDLVMTDLRTPAAALRVPKNLFGRMFLRDARGNLVVELNKPMGRTVELALDAQPYQILLDQDGHLSRASVNLPANTTTELRADQFVAVEGQRYRLRGDDLELRDQCKNVPFGVGLLPPVSNNSRYRFLDPKPCIRNSVSLHFLWGANDELTGVAVALGANESDKSARGVQVAVGANWTKDMGGVQVAVGVNYARTMGGVQVGVGPNLVLEQSRGVQAALINLSGKHTGAQLGLINGGFQAYGVQAGLVNMSERFQGLQAGLANVNVKQGRGAMLGLANVSAGPSASGAQIGLLNIATGSMSGAQVGLINYADKAGGQVGPISITRQGGVHALLFSSDAVPVQAGARFDADHTYASLLAGFTPEGGADTYALGFGFGGKIRLPYKLWLEPGLDNQYLAFDGKMKAKGGPSTLSRITLQARYEYMPHLSFFGGPLYQIVIHNDPELHGRFPGYLSGTSLHKSGKTQIMGSVGLVAGVRL